MGRNPLLPGADTCPFEAAVNPDRTVSLLVQRITPVIFNAVPNQSAGISVRRGT